MNVKLTELYGTKFFYKTLCTDLSYLFTSICRLRDKEEGYTVNIGNPLLGKVYEAAKQGEEIIIDLADCRITNDALTCIYNAENNGIKFRDSKMEWRNNLFIENERRRTNWQDGNNLPVFDYKDDIRQYIKELSTTVCYCAAGQQQHVLIALTCLVFMVRPKVRICIDPIARTFFKFVNTKIPTEEILKARDFWMCSDEGVQHVTGDKFYVQEAQCELSIQDALQYVILVPYDFGSKPLLRNPAYSGLFRTCLLLLQEYQESSPRSLEELYA